MSIETIPATLESIVGEAVKMKSQGQRLLTMSAVSLDENTVDLLYHFDQDLTMTHYRLTVDKNKPVPSISPVYFAAFLVENEIQDQFGVKFDGLVLDFGGKLYLDEEAQRTPFCKFAVTRKEKAEPKA